VKIKLFVVIMVIAAAGAAFVSFKYYGYIFAKDVKGVVVDVARVNQNTAIITGNGQVPAAQMFSFAIAIKSTDGEIFTASSEDRQWAVVKQGQCAEAKFYPYPFWELDRSGTYHGARLLKLYDCPSEFAKPQTQPSPS
jgi:hypothetical protein